MKSITDYEIIHCALCGYTLIGPEQSEMDLKQARFNCYQKHKDCMEIMAKAEGREVHSKEKLLFD